MKKPGDEPGFGAFTGHLTLWTYDNLGSSLDTALDLDAASRCLVVVGAPAVQSGFHVRFDFHKLPLQFKIDIRIDTRHPSACDDDCDEGAAASLRARFDFHTPLSPFEFNVTR